MNSLPLDRRAFLATSAAAGVGIGAGVLSAANPPPVVSELTAKRYQNDRSPWPICLDGATIRPSSLEDKVRIAAEAGYDAFEPWEGDLHQYEQAGGNLKDLGQKIRDAGLFVPSVIGLWNAIPATEEAWKTSLIQSRRRMRQASDIGAQHIQVVPQPARDWRKFDPRWAADRYRDLLEIGLRDYQINPAIVFVEFLEGAKRMGQAAAIAMDADHPKAKIIPDVFHMYIGDSGFNSLRHIRGEFIAIFQFNDAPTTPPKGQLRDEHRVYPGDGILPLEQCLRDLKEIDYRGSLSVELYNKSYWKKDPLEVAKTGLRKTLVVIEKSGV